MKRYLSLMTALDEATKQDSILSDGFIAAIPNYLGINLCSVSGFVIDQKENGDLNSIEILFKNEETSVN